jgi:hypothetical protein
MCGRWLGRKVVRDGLEDDGTARKKKKKLGDCFVLSQEQATVV